MNICGVLIRGSDGGEGASPCRVGLFQRAVRRRGGGHASRPERGEAGAARAGAAGQSGPERSGAAAVGQAGGHNSPGWVLVCEGQRRGGGQPEWVAAVGDGLYLATLYASAGSGPSAGGFFCWPQLCLGDPDPAPATQCSARLCYVLILAAGAVCLGDPCQACSAGYSRGPGRGPARGLLEFWSGAQAEPGGRYARLASGREDSSEKRAEQGWGERNRRKQAGGPLTRFVTGPERGCAA